MGTVSSYGVEYSGGLLGTVHYSFTDQLSIGTGLGFRIGISSVIKIPDADETLKAKYYKPVMPVIPIEASLKLAKVIFNIRYEYGLLNRFKGDLADYKTDKYGLLIFETGFRIK